MRFWDDPRHLCFKLARDTVCVCVCVCVCVVGGGSSGTDAVVWETKGGGGVTVPLTIALNESLQFFVASNPCDSELC